MRNQTYKDAAVFVLLVAIGVIGRWGQPDWAITPIAATALFASYYFGRVGIAILVPVLAMLISDVALSSYHRFGVMLAVYLSMALPALLGKWLRKGEGARWIAKLAVSSAAPALFFFIVVNLAVWAWSTQPAYDKSLTGLAECYLQAAPFDLRRLLGDMFFVTLIFGAAAGVASLSEGAHRRIATRA